MPALQRLLVAALPFVVAGALAPATASAQSDDGVELERCPGTFHIVHADRVGAARFAAGIHAISVAGSVTCEQAPGLLGRFLQDWDGRLPSPWVVRASGEFERGTSGNLLKVAPATLPVRPALSCPAFTILRASRVGAVRLPAGRYATVRLGRLLDCPQAARELRDLLAAGALPDPWRAEDTGAGRATFRRGAASTYGLRVRRAFEATAGGGSYPAAGRTRCPGVFLVRNDNRIGALRVRRGAHHLTVLGTVTCPQAVAAFRVFLGRPAGDLPRPWRLRAASGSFERGAGGGSGFWIDRAYE